MLQVLRRVMAFPCKAAREALNKSSLRQQAPNRDGIQDANRSRSKATARICNVVDRSGRELADRTGFVQRFLGCGLLLPGLLLLTGCSTAPPVKEQTGLNLRVETSAQLNPDEKGRAAPIMVRVYELRSTTAFESADFFALQNDSKNTLAGDALAVDEFILRPGDKQLIQRKSNPQTVAIGVLAGYRDLGKSVWRATWALMPAPEAAWYRAAIPANKAELRIYLDQQSISITDLDNNGSWAQQPVIEQKRPGMPGMPSLPNVADYANQQAGAVSNVKNAISPPVVSIPQLVK